MAAVIALTALIFPTSADYNEATNTLSVAVTHNYYVNGELSDTATTSHSYTLGESVTFDTIVKLSDFTATTRNGKEYSLISSKWSNGDAIDDSFGIGSFGDYSGITLDYNREAVMYNVTYSGPYITALPSEQHEAGDTVSFVPIPNKGYELSGALCEGNGYSSFEATNNGGTYSFTMPAGDVTVSVAASLIDHNLYTVTYNGEHMTALPSETYKAGEVMGFMPAADTGYKITVVTGTANGVPIEIKNKSGAYWFTMPAGDVAINVQTAAVYNVKFPVDTRYEIACKDDVYISGDTVTFSVTHDTSYFVASVAYSTTTSPIPTKLPPT